MTFIVAVFGMLILALGVYALVTPPGLMQLVSSMNSTPGLWVAAGLRLLFGVALWVSAPASHTPVVFQVLAVIALVAAVALPIIGIDRLGALIDWWTEQPPGLVRGWSIFVIAFGAYLVWSAAL